MTILSRRWVCGLIGGLLVACGPNAALPELPEPSTEPPTMSGGQTGEGGGPIPMCIAEKWTSPETERIVARCETLVVDGEPLIGTYRCTCDTRSCPRDPEQPWDEVRRGRYGEWPEEDPCLIEITADECNDALLELCDVEAPTDGFCERDTLDNQQLTCFEQEGGSHLCRCPGQDGLVTSSETDCNEALRTACSQPCETVAGRCEPTGSGTYDCDCASGISDTFTGFLCEDVLRAHCEPACEDERGGCYYAYLEATDQGQYTCACAGDDELHETLADESALGDVCLDALERSCGER